MRDYYRILGIRPDATQAEIKEAWNFSIKAFHPDKFAGSSQRQQAVAQERTKAINEAYEVLSDPIKRASYDREYAKQFRTHAGPRPRKSPPPPPGRATQPSHSAASSNRRSSTAPRFGSLFPYQKQTADKWWHRLAKVTFVCLCIIVPPFIWLKVTVSEFDGCFQSFLSKPTGRGYYTTILKSDEDYQERRALSDECVVNAKEAGLTLILVTEAAFIAASNILYYRVILYIGFGRAKKGLGTASIYITAIIAALILSDYGERFAEYAGACTNIQDVKTAAFRL